MTATSKGQALRIGILCFALCMETACLGFGNLGGSGGPRITSEPGPAENALDGKFSTVYTTWLEFDRDLTVVIDNTLAQVADGNKDVTQEAARYFGVGLDVLQQRHGIAFTSRPIYAGPQERAIRLGPTTAEWVYSVNSSQSSIPSILWTPSSRPVRWLGTLQIASLSFNSWEPKKVDIYAKLNITVEQKTGFGKWEPVRIRLSSVGAIQNELADLMTTAYGKYLEQRFNVNTDSPKFRGMHPISNPSK
jgi:hypothetical protein